MPDTITLTTAEYQDLIDARDHAVAMRNVATGAMETLNETDMDAYLAAATPLRFWRLYRGLTQGTLAAAAGISQPSLANAEAGTRGVTVMTLARLASALHVRMEDLITES